MKKDIINKMQKIIELGDIKGIKLIENETEEDTINVITLVSLENPSHLSSELVDVLNDNDDIDEFYFPVITNDTTSYKEMKGEVIYGGDEKADI